MSSLVDYLNERIPSSAPLGSLIVVSGLFVLAWLVSRAAGRIASLVVIRSERRRSADLHDTGVIASLKQRETAISLGSMSLRSVASPARLARRSRASVRGPGSRAEARYSRDAATR